MPSAPAVIPKKKPRATPGGKMKQLQWMKMPANKVKGTVFEGMPEQYSNVVKLDYGTLEAKFSAKVIEKKEDSASKQAAAAKKKEGPPPIVDPKTGQALNIFLNQFKTMELSTLARALATCDRNLVTLDQVRTLKKILPTEDDTAAIHAFMADMGTPQSDLGQPERFALELEKVSHLRLRLTGFALMLSFDARKAEVKPGLNAIASASEEFARSAAWKDLMELLLEVGNFLNNGTPRGGIFAFKMDSLRKLGDTKSGDNSISLLMYIADALERTEGGQRLLNFISEMPHAAQASAVSRQTVEADLRELKGEFKMVDDALSGSGPAGLGESAPDFAQSIGGFMAAARTDLEQMERNAKVMDAAYAQAASLMGEVASTMQPEEFFGSVKAFSDSLRAAARALKEAEENAAKAGARAAAKASREAGIAQRRAEANPAEGDVMGELMGALRGGNIFANRRNPNPKQGAGGPKPGAGAGSPAIGPGMLRHVPGTTPDSTLKKKKHSGKKEKKSKG
jgi:Formin Homology 2 Domain